MLGKLFKHEFKGVGKVHGLLYLLTAIYTGFLIIYDKVLGIFTEMPEWFEEMTDILSLLLMTGYIVVLIAVNILTFVYLIYRFYQSMVGDEGYLTHTLPVTTGQLLFVKTAVASCFQIVSLLVSGISAFIMFVGIGAWDDIWGGIREILIVLDESGIMCGNFVIFMLLLIVSIVISAAGNMLIFYFCIAAGNLFTGHKLLGSIVVYIIHNIVVGIAQWILMVIISLAVSLNEEYLTRLERWMEEMQVQDVLGAFNGFFAVALLVYSVICFVYFMVTRYILKNKLNLA